MARIARIVTVSRRPVPPGFPLMSSRPGWKMAEVSAASTTNQRSLEKSVGLSSVRVTPEMSGPAASLWSRAAIHSGSA